MDHPHSINRLPAELLLSIFRLIGTHGGPHKLPGIVIASHVCKRWRYLTVQTQSLWTVISISNTEKDYAHHARVWLMRSGVLPVDITVHWDSSWVERKAEEALFPIDDAAPWADETSQYIRRSYMEYERFRELKRQSLMCELEHHKHRWRSFKWNTTSDRLIEEIAYADVTIVDVFDYLPGTNLNQAIYTGMPRDSMSVMGIQHDSMSSIVSLHSKTSVHTGKNSFLTRQKTSARRFWSKFWDLLHF